MSDVCAKCGSEMEKGFITVLGGRPLVWSEKPIKNIWRPVLIVGYPKGVEEIIPFSSGSFVSMEAHRCKACRTITFNY